MQKADALEVMKQDLKETVSSLRMEEYRRVLGRVKHLADLRDVEFEVRVDTRLSPNHREQLLRCVESAARAIEPENQFERSSLGAKPEGALVWRLPRRACG